MNALWDDWAYRVGWTLVHSLWQGAAVAAALLAALPLLHRRTAAARYRLSVMALASLAAWVAITACRCGSPADATTDAAAGPSRPQRQVIGPSVRTTPEVDTLPAEPPVPAVAVVPVMPLAQRYLPWLTAAWASGALLVGLWNALQWIAVQRLRVVGVSAASDAVVARSGQLASRLGFGQAVAVALSSLVDSPLVVGWLRPMILLPVSVVTELSPAQLEGILAHELAHVRRHDYLVNLIQVALETLLFYHPAVWWISRRIRLEREQCCDELAVEACGDPITYAESLAALAGRLSLSLAPAARGDGGGQLLRRVRRVLGADEPAPARATAGGVVLILLVVIGCATASRTSTRKSSAPVAAASAPTTRDAPGVVFVTDSIRLQNVGRGVRAICYDDETGHVNSGGVFGGIGSSETELSLIDLHLRDGTCDVKPRGRGLRLTGWSGDRFDPSAAQALAKAADGGQPILLVLTSPTARPDDVLNAWQFLMGSGLQHVALVYVGNADEARLRDVKWSTDALVDADAAVRALLIVQMRYKLRRYDYLAGGMTPLHPNVIAVDREIQRLDQAIAARKPWTDRPTTSASAATRP